jgi:hypothetical protein
MPVQKRPLPLPHSASDDDDHAAAAASCSGGGGSRGTDGEAAAGQGSVEPRDGGEPNDPATPLSLDARNSFDALRRGRV